jgi:signal transduction histidine kinase
VLSKVKPCPLEGDDVLAKAARTKQSQLVLDSRNETCGSMKAASDEGVVSQYVAPLEGDDGQVHAVIQIDLGDISYDKDLYESEKFVLEALCKIVSSGLNRSFEAEVSRIIRRLDRAMSDCLKEKTIKAGLQRYLEQGLAAFGLKEGHIRIAQEDIYKLALIAGIGDYYSEWLQRRRKIDFADQSPTAQAFRSEKISVVNNPSKHTIHQALFRLTTREEVIRRKLSEVGSYANIPFKSELGERGVVNLLSSERWFFTWSHDNALKAFGRRVGFLLETLRRKERESFLLGASPQFSRIRNFDELGTVLASETKRFAKSAKAKIASLYLWDEDRKRYVLRAQHGWLNPRWVNAAYYLEDENWTGSAALAGTPRHIPDLCKYYESVGESTPRYTVDAFGQQLTWDSNMEAICLLLRLGDDDKLGVLTLYRPIKEGEESGFITTDTELLQQGADNFSSLIGIMQAKVIKSWRAREQSRRQQIYDATLLARDEDRFESDVSRQVLLSYRAVRVAFYKVESVGVDPKVKFRRGFQRNSKTDEVKSWAAPPDEAELELVSKTVASNWRNEKVVVTDRVKLDDGESPDSERVGLAGLVRRACIPLVSEKRLRGILDLSWVFDPWRLDNPDYYHGEGYLRILGEVVGSAYGRLQTKSRAELLRAEGEEKLQQGEAKLQESEDRTRDGVQATTAYVLQHHHELRTIIQDMRTQFRLLKGLRADRTADEKLLLEELSNSIEEGTTTLKRMIQIGRKVVAPACKWVTARDLIQSALEKPRAHYARHDYEVLTPDVPKDYLIWADSSLMNIALGNLLDNAFKSMLSSPTRRLAVEAEPNGREMTLTIKDTGKGMSPKKIKRILEEFYSVNGRISVGVMISRLILKLHGGTLDYHSTVGKGTDTIIVLPIDQMEENL